MAKIGYARVSTDEQNLALQIDALRIAGCEDIITDEGITGAARKRPGLDKALAKLKEGDALVVWKLDRLGRSLSHLIAIMDDLRERNVGFQSITDGINSDTPGGKLHFQIMGALAEFERSLIVERTQAGLEAAKRRGVKLGPKYQINRHQIEDARRRVESGETVAHVARSIGCHRSTLARRLAN